MTEQMNFYTTSENGETRVPLKTICEIVGIKWENQRTKIADHFFLGQLPLISGAVALDGAGRDQVTMSVPDTYAWLAGVGTRNRTQESIEKQKAILDTLRSALFETIERAEKYTPQHQLNDEATAERLRAEQDLERAEALFEEKIGEQAANLRRELGIDDLKARTKAAKAKETKIRNAIGFTQLQMFDAKAEQLPAGDQ